MIGIAGNATDIGTGAGACIYHATIHRTVLDCSAQIRPTYNATQVFGTLLAILAFHDSFEMARLNHFFAVAGHGERFPMTRSVNAYRLAQVSVEIVGVTCIILFPVRACHEQARIIDYITFHLWLYIRFLHVHIFPNVLIVDYYLLSIDDVDAVGESH